jgi:hypothetical protein
MLDLTSVNFLVLESARSVLIPYAKCLHILDLGECCDALLYLQSRYWLDIDESLLLNALLNIRLTDLCPS